MISSAVSFLKELGYTRFRCRTDREPAIKAMVDGHQVFDQSSKSCQRRQIPKVMRVWVLWEGFTQSSARTKIERCNSFVEDRFGSIVRVTFQCVPCLVRHATRLPNRFQRRQNGATAFENLKGVSFKKPLMQFGERCHWLEAERITNKHDRRC